MAIGKSITVNANLEKSARARIAEINWLCDYSPLTDEERAALLSERESLVDSWITVEEIDIPTALDGADAVAAGEALDNELFNESVKAELLQNDLKAIRALIEGDSTRIQNWLDTQAALRASLK